ncbi:MAG: hypothetical protein AAF633_28685, partial [Chloroflexota bacterium]
MRMQKYTSWIACLFLMICVWAGLRTVNGQNDQSAVINARLNGPKWYGNIENVRVSPNGSFAVYTVNTFGSRSKYELYAVETDGNSQPIKLSHELLDTETIRFYEIAPDSQSVVYQTMPNGLGPYYPANRLFSVPISGGEAIQLSSTSGPDGGGQVSDYFVISPDSRYVVYKSNAALAAANEFYSVPLNGGDSIKLHPDITADQLAVGANKISIDSRYVLIDLKETNTEYTTYLSSLNGDPPIAISSRIDEGLEGPYVSFASDGGDLFVHYVDVAKDSSLLFYRQPLAGGNPIETFGSVEGFFPHSFERTSDDAFIVMTAKRIADGVNEYYALPSEGGTLSEVFDADLFTQISNVTLLPDGSGVLIEGVKLGNETLGLYTAVWGGGTVVTLVEGYANIAWTEPLAQVDRLVFAGRIDDQS